MCSRCPHEKSGSWQKRMRGVCVTDPAASFAPRIPRVSEMRRAAPGLGARSRTLLDESVVVVAFVVRSGSTSVLLAHSIRVSAVPRQMVGLIGLEPWMTRAVLAFEIAGISRPQLYVCGTSQRRLSARIHCVRLSQIEEWDTLSP